MRRSARLSLRAARFARRGKTRTLGGDVILSREVPPAVAAEVAHTEALCMDFLRGVMFLAMDTARDPEFANNHFLAYVADDYLESAVAIPSTVREGIHNVCFRELRFLLELSVKVCFVQQQDYHQSVEEKLAAFREQLNSPSISIKNNVELSLLPAAERPTFLEETGRIYGATSNYVHLTFNQMKVRLAQIENGRTPGNETPEEVSRLNDLVLRVLSTSFVYIAHSVPSYAVGDFFVGSDGSSRRWSLCRSQYVALLDESFDYKHERQATLDRIKKMRWDNVSVVAP